MTYMDEIRFGLPFVLFALCIVLAVIEIIRIILHLAKRYNRLDRVVEYLMTIMCGTCLLAGAVLTLGVLSGLASCLVRMWL